MRDFYIFPRKIGKVNIFGHPKVNGESGTPKEKWEILDTQNWRNRRC